MVIGFVFDPKLHVEFAFQSSFQVCLVPSPCEEILKKESQRPDDLW